MAEKRGSDTAASTRQPAQKRKKITSKTKTKTKTNNNNSPNTSKKTTSVFPFLSLPREIRDQIYKLCVIICPHPSTHYFYCGDCGGFHKRGRVREAFDILRIGARRPKGPLEPSLTHVSKKIRNEVLPIYYGKNHFIVFMPYLSTVGMAKWLTQITTERSKMIKTMTLFLIGSGGSLDLLNHFKSLQDYLSEECTVHLRGNGIMVSVYERLRSLVMRSHSRGVNWTDIKKDQQDIVDLVEEILPDYGSEWASGFEDFGSDCIEYCEDDCLVEAGMF